MFSTNKSKLNNLTLMSKISSGLSSIISGLNQQEKYILLQDFIFLSNHLQFIFGMPEPWLIIVDNQILNDLKYKHNNKNSVNNRKRYIRLISVFMIFDFLTSYSETKIRIALTPCLFYEFNNRNIISDKKSFYNSLDACFSLLKEFKVKNLVSLGLDDYQIASSNLKKIIHDEKQIIKLIQRLKKKEMTFDIYQKLPLNIKSSKKSKIELFKPPFLIASQIAARQKISLKYFNRNVVNNIIACHLENKVYSDSVQTNLLKTKMKNFRNNSINKTASLSKIAKGKLKGLADIELIQYCNISRQFDYELEYTLYPLTFDKTLAHILQERTGFDASMTISGGDSQEDLTTKRDNFANNLKRMDAIKQRSKKMFSQLSYFYQDLSPLLS